jgi:hypothetical protein
MRSRQILRAVRAAPIPSTKAKALARELVGRLAEMGKPDVPFCILASIDLQEDVKAAE